MKNKVSLIIILLFAVAIISGIFIYRNLQKRHERLVQNVRSAVDFTSHSLHNTYQNNIKALNKYFKSDSADVQIRSGAYAGMIWNRESLTGAMDLFYLLARLQYNGENDAEYDSITGGYDSELAKLQIFYAFHPESGVLKDGAIDTLILYNKNLAAYVEHIKKMSIKP